jgi:hypothetical protein
VWRVVEPDGRLGEHRRHPGHAALELIEVLHLAEGQAVQYSTEVFAPGSVDLHVIRGLAG